MGTSDEFNSHSYPPRSHVNRVCQVILRKAWPSVIVSNLVWEINASCTFKTSFVDLEKKRVGTLRPRQNVKVFASSQLSIIVQWQPQVVDMVVLKFPRLCIVLFCFKWQHTYMACRLLLDIKGRTSYVLTYFDHFILPRVWFCVNYEVLIHVNITLSHGCHFIKALATI